MKTINEESNAMLTSVSLHVDVHKQLTDCQDNLLLSWAKQQPLWCGIEQQL